MIAWDIQHYKLFLQKLNIIYEYLTYADVDDELLRVLPSSDIFFYFINNLKNVFLKMALLDNFFLNAPQIHFSFQMSTGLAVLLK